MQPSDRRFVGVDPLLVLLHHLHGKVSEIWYTVKALDKLSWWEPAKGCVIQGGLCALLGARLLASVCSRRYVQTSRPEPLK